MNNQRAERVAVGRRLRGARESAHLSVEDAAQASGVQALAIDKWERGAALPNLLQLRALIELYGVMACQVLYDNNPWVLPAELAAELGRAARSFSPALRTRVDVYLATHSRGVEPVFKPAG